MAKPKIKHTFKATGLVASLYGLKPLPTLPVLDLEVPVALGAPPMVYLKASVTTGVDLAKVIATEMEMIGEQEVKEVMQTMAVRLKTALDTAIRSPVWVWPSGGARDIYDTGRLASSGSVTIKDLALIVSYEAPYARLVHDGGYIQPYGNPNARPVYMPGRPWIASTIYGGGPVPKFDFGAEIRGLA